MLMEPWLKFIKNNYWSRGNQMNALFWGGFVYIKQVSRRRGSFQAPNSKVQWKEEKRHLFVALGHLNMSAMVEMCVGELSKLRDKLLSPNSNPTSSSSKSKESSSRSPQSPRNQTILKNTPPVEMSESTVSLLMDRFAPCWYTRVFLDILCLYVCMSISLFG